jgi:hypothetical protein
VYNSSHDSFDPFHYNCLQLIPARTTATRLKQNCQVVCTDYTGPIVIRVKQDVIVLADDDDLILTCPNNKTTTHALENYGSYLVKVPCQCSIKVGDSTYPPMFPCLTENINISIQASIPAIITKLDEVVLSYNTPKKEQQHYWITTGVHISATLTYPFRRHLSFLIGICRNYQLLHGQQQSPLFLQQLLF